MVKNLVNFERFVLDFGSLKYFLSRATKSKEASTSIQGKATLYIEPHDNDSKEFNLQEKGESFSIFFQDGFLEIEMSCDAP